MRSKQYEVLNHFLEDVDEQIQYRPMHAAVNEELRAHIEDKAETYMDYGMEEEEAYKRAVRDMGDASAIGIEMNEAHHLRTAWPVLLLIFALMAVGFAGKFVIWGLAREAFTDSACFFWGLLVLFFVLHWGYPFLLKYADMFVILSLAGFIGLTAMRYIFWLGPGLLDKKWFYGFNSLRYALAVGPSAQFGIFQIAVPASVVLLYRKRRGIKGLLFLGAFLAVFVGISQFLFLGGYLFVPVLTLLVSGLGVVIYMMAAGMLEIKQKTGFAAAALGFLALLALWVLPQRENMSELFRQAVSPRARAGSAYSDAYDSVLMRELLGRSEWFGQIRLSREEMVRYGTAQWYFEDGPGHWTHDLFSLEEHVDYRMQFLEHPGLEDILPQSYGTNYRIAWWILRYGKAAGILLILLNVSVYVLMFWTALHIRNRLGRLTALSGSLALGIQFLFYLFGNFGWRFGDFGNLPFVSEGLVSITGTMVMAGLLLSAYRFDTVMTESA